MLVIIRDLKNINDSFKILFVVFQLSGLIVGLLGDAEEKGFLKMMEKAEEVNWRALDNSACTFKYIF